MRKVQKLIRLLIFAGLIFSSGKIFSQDIPQSKCIDISKIDLVKNISNNDSTCFIDKYGKSDFNYTSLHFTKGNLNKNYIPNNLVSKKIILKFTLCNTADSSFGVWFFPGFFFTDTRLYCLQQNKVQDLPSILPDNPDSIGYRYISLKAHDTTTYLVELTQVKTYLNHVVPRLINPDYLNLFVTNIHINDKEGDVLTYVVCGMMLMMILFSLIIFSLGAAPEFLYYSGYALFLGFMLFIKALLNYRASHLNFFIEAYLDFILQGLSIMCYMVFMQKFLETRKSFRFLYHFYNAGMIMLTASLLGFSYSHFFTNNFVLENGIENNTKLILLAMIIIFLIYSLRHWDNKLLRYIFWGNFFLFIFSLASQASIMFFNLFKSLPGVLNSGLFYYEAGLLLELAFFLSGLQYKNSSRLIHEAREKEKLKAENKMKEYEKELAVYKAHQEERNRISADIHDELGSGMTAIRLMSEIARNKMKENTPVEIEKISYSADDLLNKMNAIVWSMYSGNDTLDNLVFYIRSYAMEYFENTNLHCQVNASEQIPDKELSGDKRRNVFLCVKETLNNVLKHAKASELKIDIITNHSLIIKITDNGIGIDTKKLRQFGNGLKNIARRMESVGGTFKIENNKGTVTTLELLI